MLARGRGGALPVLRVRMAALIAKARVAGRDPAMELRAAARQYLDLVRRWERSARA